jgi:hypothetical protein
MLLVKFAFSEPRPTKTKPLDLREHLDRVIAERDAFDAELRAAEQTIAKLQQVIERRERVLCG